MAAVAPCSQHDTFWLGLLLTTLAGLATAGFFGGMLLTSLIDFVVPSWENPHETPLVGEAQPTGLHNFPEGVATMFATQTDPTLFAPCDIAEDSVVPAFVPCH